MACKHKNLDSSMVAGVMIYSCRDCPHTTETRSARQIAKAAKAERESIRDQRRGDREAKRAKTAQWRADQEAFAPNKRRGRRRRYRDD